VFPVFKLPRGTIFTFPHLHFASNRLAFWPLGYIFGFASLIMVSWPKTAPFFTDIFFLMPGIIYFESKIRALQSVDFMNILKGKSRKSPLSPIHRGCIDTKCHIQWVFPTFVGMAKD